MRVFARAFTASALLLPAAVFIASAREGGIDNTPQGRPAAKARQAASAMGSAQAAAAPAAAAAESPGGGGSQMLEEVHRQEEAAASGKGLSYEPGDRRDPFVSPAESAKEPEGGSCEGEGMECWLISEIQIVGMLARRSGGVALVVGPEGYGASLRAGDKLYDGEVLSVDPSTGLVVFRQKVNDPTRIKPYRDIEKKLNMTREGGV